MDGTYYLFSLFPFNLQNDENGIQFWLRCLYYTALFCTTFSFMPSMCTVQYLCQNSHAIHIYENQTSFLSTSGGQYCNAMLYLCVSVYYLY